jgi:hypothetical protein
METVLNPLEKVDELFASNPSAEFFSSEQFRAYFEERIQNEPGFLAQIPYLTKTAVRSGRLKSRQLVRYRGLVRDIFDPEFYVGIYNLTSTNGHTGEGGNGKITTSLCSKYRDGIDTTNERRYTNGGEWELALEGPGCVTFERTPVLCSPLVGESAWAKNTSFGLSGSATETPQTDSGTSGSQYAMNNNESSLKRSRAPEGQDEVGDLMMDLEPAASSSESQRTSELPSGTPSLTHSRPPRSRCGSSGSSGSEDSQSRKKVSFADTVLQSGPGSDSTQTARSAPLSWTEWFQEQPFHDLTQPGDEHDSVCAILRIYDGMAAKVLLSPGNLGCGVGTEDTHGAPTNQGNSRKTQSHSESESESESGPLKINDMIEFVGVLGELGCEIGSASSSPNACPGQAQPSAALSTVFNSAPTGIEGLMDWEGSENELGASAALGLSAQQQVLPSDLCPSVHCLALRRLPAGFPFCSRPPPRPTSSSTLSASTAPGNNFPLSPSLSANALGPAREMALEAIFSTLMAGRHCSEQTGMTGCSRNVRSSSDTSSSDGSPSPSLSLRSDAFLARRAACNRVAAEYVLLGTLSRVYSRSATAGVVLGVLGINLRYTVRKNVSAYLPVWSQALLVAKQLVPPDIRLNSPQI